MRWTCWPPRAVGGRSIGMDRCSGSPGTSTWSASTRSSTRPPRTSCTGGGCAASHPTPSTSEGAAMYDYVIVGAGSTGCALAAPLSGDPDVSVCLVEAGPAGTGPDPHLPAAFAQPFPTHL